MVWVFRMFVYGTLYRNVRLYPLCVSCSIQEQATGDSVDDRRSRRASFVARRAFGTIDRGETTTGDARRRTRRRSWKGGARTSIGFDFRFGFGLFWI